MQAALILAVAATGYAQQCSTNWSQCNGQNWPANNVCCQDSGFQCNFKNQYLSLCEPKPKKDTEDDESHTWTIARWGQCGGKNFVTNNGVCGADDKCQYWNEWYSQCIPKGNDDNKVQPRWAQCGGKDYKGPTKCGSQDKCQSWNEWYSQCIPNDQANNDQNNNQNKQCSTNYSQCNGQNWSQGVCCQDPNFECKFKTEYLSTCEPKPKKDVEDEASQPKQCSTDWSQCNGQNWPHGVCCQNKDFQCNFKNQYLSLCEPKPKKDAEDAEYQNKHQCSTNWSQCNGQNWPFGVCCQDSGYECNYKNQYLSLCEPKKHMDAEDDESHTWTIPRWGQCGGKTYVSNNGACAPEDKCQYWNEWYSQCIPNDQANNQNKQCSTNYSQCNGQNWPHGVCCQDPNFECKYKNQYLSTCEPKQ
ncbi:Aste57867_24994 [Aphanomyces stellatus]|uniref:Aste57867_24994 protein n=1 Tax=Aphanomyces stellatus TaxID=120398 RepID=A0A485LRX9_9STRA|nr:hypothetical protein As57867_024916 [Aphanomyces stellatus]VFU01625.1 Aste57867_24994 [Aphanomyces stellatus]